MTTMNEYLIGIGINVTLTLLKNPEHRQKFRSALLKIYKAIKAGFPTDPDFQ